MTHVYLPKNSGPKVYPKLGLLRFQPLATMPRSFMDDIDENPCKLRKWQKYCIVTLGTISIYILVLITLFIVLVSVFHGWDHDHADWSWWMYVLYLYISILLSCILVSWVPFCICSTINNDRVFIYPGRIPHKEDEVAVINVDYGATGTDRDCGNVSDV